MKSSNAIRSPSSRWAREAKKALKLAHPNIVSVYNFTRDGGNVFMVMELLEGRSLDQVLKAEGAAGLPRERAVGNPAVP